MTWRRDDKYTVSLLHMRGANNSTTFIDEVGKTWTPAADARIVTAQSVFGGTSMVLDGTGDWIYSADNPDWRLDGGSNSNTWTFDGRFRFNGDPGTATMGLVTQYVDTNNYWTITLSNNALYFIIRSGGVNIVAINNAWNPASATWYHVMVVKDGTNGYMMFIDGAQIGTTQTDTDPMPDFAGSMYIGRRETTECFNGWIDETRFSKGIARKTANFVIPTQPYLPVMAIAHITSK